jgi:hypothetical protein
MTLIVRFITKKRVIFLADGRITILTNPIPIIVREDAKKLFKCRNVIIGISGSIQYGHYIPKPGHPLGTTTGQIDEDLNNFFGMYNTDFTIETLEKLKEFFIGKFSIYHNDRLANNGNISVTFMISYRINDQLEHSKLKIFKNEYGYDYEIFKIELENGILIDLNLDIDTEKFDKMVNYTCQKLFKSTLDADKVVSISNDEIKQFGNELFKDFAIEFKNPTVGLNFMNEQL